jgi:formate/nitrite transporter FocA (FNT family)
MAWASRHLSWVKVVRNWGIVLPGNLVGDTLPAIFLFISRQYMMGNGAVNGVTA